MKIFLIFLLSLVSLYISFSIAENILDVIFKDMYINFVSRILTSYFVFKLFLWAFEDWIIENFD